MKEIHEKTIDKHSDARDSYILKYKNQYYHCFVDDASVSLSCADTIEELQTADNKLNIKKFE